jgi:hypothetical protein
MSSTRWQSESYNLFNIWKNGKAMWYHLAMSPSFCNQCWRQKHMLSTKDEISYPFLVKTKTHSQRMKKDTAWSRQLKSADVNMKNAKLRLPSALCQQKNLPARSGRGPNTTKTVYCCEKLHSELSPHFTRSWELQETNSRLKIIHVGVSDTNSEFHPARIIAGDVQENVLIISIRLKQVPGHSP